MTTDQTLTEAVQRGCAWLDSVKPGWEREIDLDGLEMGSCRHCVLGQMFGDFARAMKLFDLADEWVDAHAFDLGESKEFDWDYLDLTETWIAEITRRREARP